MNFKCKNCYNIYSSTNKKSKFCSNTCKKEYMHELNEEHSLAHKKKLLKNRIKQCQKCAIKNKHLLEVHHILPICEGGSDDYSNLIVLCSNCHTLEHHKENASSLDSIL